MQQQTIWQYRVAPGTKPAPELVEAARGSHLLARLLQSRGLTTPEAIATFLNLDDWRPTTGLELPEMDKAVERIRRAIDQQENILIFGDFDVDGITGTSILMEALTFLGAKVTYYIPDRAREGHGLNTQALIRLKSSRQFKLVVTTDTGITNFAEVSLLKGLGVDTVVTDHHELPENLPPSVANVNPKLLSDQSHPLAPLCGAGVAYKLCELLLDGEAEQNPERREACEVAKLALLDLTAIGTVADLASLVDENRYLVYEGLKVLNTRQRLGVTEILAQAGTAPETTLTSESIAFTIAPRLNALGRLDNAQEAVPLLITQDADEARRIAAHLEQLNRKRRELCDKIFLEAEHHLMATGGLDGLKQRKTIVLASPDWHLGVIGIVASRIIEKYHVPVFMMMVDEEKGVARCSARSIPGFHLHDALVPLSHYFDVFGGHAGAGGFTIPLNKLEAFKQDLYAVTGSTITEAQMCPVRTVDDTLDWTQLNPHLIELVNTMAPFGMDNPSPKFVLEKVMVSAQRPLGEAQRHLKLILTHAGQAGHIDGLIWNAGPEKYRPKTHYSFLVVPELNVFNGQAKVQLMIEDAKLAGGAAVPEEKPVAPVSVAMPASSVSEPSTLAASRMPGVKWIDHRQRDAVAQFVGDLMMPVAGERKLLVYHEGRAPEIPFLRTEHLASRLALAPVEELILWDLPPSRELFAEVLATTQPSLVHLVGGKYQAQPVSTDPEKYLTMMLQLLKQWVKKQLQLAAATEPVLETTLGLLASTMAASDRVVMHGLMLLEKLGHIAVAVAPAVAEQPPAAMRLTLRLLPGTASLSRLDDQLAFVAFAHELAEVGRFRQWLIQSGLDTIKADFAMVRPAPAPDARAPVASA
ncbi:MAG: single-stranded-DNA-specific exonuclease RecJ [Candidatus Melainabacteria bacterium]